MRPYLICPTSDGNSFYPDWGSFNVHLVLGWRCIERSELMWQNEVRGQKLVYRMMIQYVASSSIWVNTRASSTNHKWSPEKGLTRNTTCSWWIALDTMKELENCLKELDRWVSRKRRNWVMLLKADVDKLELRSQLGWMWEKLLLDYFETRWGHHHLPNLWWRTLSHGLRVSYCLRGWFLPEVALEDLNSCDKT